MKVFTDISELLSLSGAAQKSGRHVHEADLGIIPDAALVLENGRVAWVGPRNELKTPSQAQIISCEGRTVVPGFIEPHTHLVFAGNRAHEFEWRMRGLTYQEIAAKGGGIRFTVEQTRRANAAELGRLVQARADRFVRQGVTTLEVKSGYGLDLPTEKRSLEVARAIQGPYVVTTYLGAHARPPETPDPDAFVDEMCNHIMPQIAPLADRVDIYIEQGFFTPAHAKTYLAKARELGLELTAHVEQLSDTGGGLAVLQFQPRSLDHLVFASDELIARLAASDTTAVLLPASDFYLKMAYPKARAMIDQGVRVALSTDFNPGTSPTQDLSLVGVLARLEMKMTLPEVIAAYTVGAAHALGAVDRGSLQPGQQADFALVDGSWQELFYSVGYHPVHSTYRGGERISLPPLVNKK